MAQVMIQQKSPEERFRGIKDDDLKEDIKKYFKLILDIK